MNDFLEAIYNALREAVLGIDANAGRILHCNPAAATLLGRSINDTLGKTIDLIAADPEAFRSFLSELRKHGAGKICCPIVRAGGANPRVEFTATLVQPPAVDHPYAILILHEDNPPAERADVEE